MSPIFLAEKRVDHESKASILKELDERYGISQESIMVDCLYTREIEVYYSQLKEHVEQKSRELVKLVEVDK